MNYHYEQNLKKLGADFMSDEDMFTWNGQFFDWREHTSEQVRVAVIELEMLHMAQHGFSAGFEVKK